MQFKFFLQGYWWICNTDMINIAKLKTQYQFGKKIPK